MKTMVGPPPPRPGCFQHDWTPWRKAQVLEGDAWQQQVHAKEYRECRMCEHYQER